MSFTISSDSIMPILGAIIGGILAYYIFTKHLLPFFIESQTKIIETNPKWIINKLHSKYYGFHDLDIILFENPIDDSPRFRYDKKENKLDFMISNDTSVADLDEIARLALLGKIKIKYGLWFDGPPAYWLSIMCYMLDGGDIKIEEFDWKTGIKSKKDNKPIDLE